MVDNSEMYAEELKFKSITIRFSVRMDAIKNIYTVLCKAYDDTRSLLWSTILLDELGQAKQFQTVTEAVAKTREVFSKYRN